jgi:hypothetical protein
VIRSTISSIPIRVKKMGMDKTIGLKFTLFYVYLHLVAGLAPLKLCEGE